MVNLTKPDSLFAMGMRPVLYSHQDAATQGMGWRRCGHEINYKRWRSLAANGYTWPKPDGSQGSFYTLSFSVTFLHPGDTYRLAHAHPYSYSDHKQHLAQLLGDERRASAPCSLTYRSTRLAPTSLDRYLTQTVPCTTLGGNECDLLTVTDSEQRCVVISARVHPGETPASWMMRGMLDFITGESAEARLLRSLFVFKIVPMLNPDGVAYGNNRCRRALRGMW
ncbi:unnamed protein product [Ascophyllum nodosum]